MMAVQHHRPRRAGWWTEGGHVKTRKSSFSTGLDEEALTLQSPSVYEVAQMLHSRETEPTAQLDHQHAVIRHLHRKANMVDD